MLIFDVGANMGSKTKIYVDKGAKVISFEPQSVCVNVLKQKFNNNKNVTIVHKGLGNKSEIKTLSICPSQKYLSTFADFWKTGRFKNSVWSDKENVEIITLDQAIQTYGTPNFCKVDVEGYELQVLQGLTQIISVISFEYTKEFPEEGKKCLDYLELLGYNYFNFGHKAENNYSFKNYLNKNELISSIKNHNEYSSVHFYGDVYAYYTNEISDELKKYLPNDYLKGTINEK